MVTILRGDLAFPHPRYADRRGLVAIGGDARPERLLLAYKSGIFPWPHEERGPLLWFSPDPRCVLCPSKVHVGRTLEKFLRKTTLEVRADTAFEQVMELCRDIPRAGQDGTWITDELIAGYVALHHAGYAHSVEVWDQGKLVGGLYGLSLGAAFFGESMFSLVPNASKIALVKLCEVLSAWQFEFVDCQVRTPHTAALGAELWTRTTYLNKLSVAMRAATKVGSWEPHVLSI